MCQMSSFETTLTVAPLALLVGFRLISIHTHAWFNEHPFSTQQRVANKKALSNLGIGQ
jgi:hypothetical protein